MANGNELAGDVRNRSGALSRDWCHAQGSRRWAVKGCQGWGLRYLRGKGQGGTPFSHSSSSQRAGSAGPPPLHTSSSHGLSTRASANIAYIQVFNKPSRLFKDRDRCIFYKMEIIFEYAGKTNTIVLSLYTGYFRIKTKIWQLHCIYFYGNTLLRYVSKPRTYYAHDKSVCSNVLAMNVKLK